MGTTPVDMSSVLYEYHEFSDVFSKSHANTLMTDQPYDLKIELEDDATPPFGSIYLLSLYELQTLREFIDEHLANDLICPTCSPSGAPVLFIPRLIYDMLTTSSGFMRAVNGKPLFPLVMDLLNGVSCLLDLPTPLLLFSAL